MGILFSGSYGLNECNERVFDARKRSNGDDIRKKNRIFPIVAIHLTRVHFEMNLARFQCIIFCDSYFDPYSKIIPEGNVYV